MPCVRQRERRLSIDSFDTSAGVINLLKRDEHHVERGGTAQLTGLRMGLHFDDLSKVLLTKRSNGFFVSPSGHIANIHNPRTSVDPGGGMLRTSFGEAHLQHRAVQHMFVAQGARAFCRRHVVKHDERDAARHTCRNV